MRFNEFITEKKDKKHKEKAKKVAKPDDIDDIEAPEQDADLDKVPHIVMQLRKAKDVMGDYPVSFKNGTKFKLIYSDIDEFLKKYDKARPSDKEELQRLAADSLQGWHEALKRHVKQEPVHKIKGDRYMSHFSGELDQL